MHTISIGKFTIVCEHNKTNRVSREIDNAILVERLPLIDEDCCEYIYYGISDCGISPELVIEGKYSPASICSFYPGILIVPKENIMFFGAGEIIQIWRLSPYEKLHEESPDCGFWGWSRYDDVVLMSGELELSAWSKKGEKLWSKFVEPPWYYQVSGGIVTTNVMDHEQSFSLYTGE